MNATHWRDSQVDASSLSIPEGRWPTDLEVDGLMYEVGIQIRDCETGQLLGVIYYRKDRTDTVTVMAA